VAHYVSLLKMSSPSLVFVAPPFFDSIVADIFPEAEDEGGVQETVLVPSQKKALNPRIFFPGVRPKLPAGPGGAPPRKPEPPKMCVLPSSQLGSGDKKVKLRAPSVF